MQALALLLSKGIYDQRKEEIEPFSCHVFIKKKLL